MPTPAIAVIPGASLLAIEQDGDCLRVRCPECRAEASVVFVGGTLSESALHHEANCQVHARIKDAERKVKQSLN